MASALNFWRIAQGVTYTPQASDPSSASNGAFYYNSTSNRLKMYVNSAWDSIPGLATTDTLTNKTISGASNTLSSIADGSLSTSYVKADGTRNLTGNWSAGAFSATFNSVIVGSAANTIAQLSTIINTGTLTLPTATDTLVARTTTDTLTNKTISGSSNTITNVSLTAGVTGTLPVANGGTNLATLTANNVILGNGTSSPLFVAPGSSGNVLTSNGTTWIATTPASSGVSTVGSFNGQTANATGLAISGTSIFAQSASVTNPGMVDTTTQSFAGLKTFTSAVTANSFIPTSSTVPVNGLFLSTTNTLGFSTNTTQAGSIDANGTWTIGASGQTNQQILRYGIQVGGSFSGSGSYINSFNSSAASRIVMILNNTATDSSAGGLNIVVGQNNTATQDALGIYNNGGAREIFKVDTSGTTTIGASGGAQTHAINTATGTNASGIGTLTNLPAGVSGNPTGYISININGSTHIIPYW